MTHIDDDKAKAKLAKVKARLAIHEAKAEAAFFDARQLLEMDRFDGAISRAAAGVLHTAKYVMTLIPSENDPEDIPTCIARMAKDGRIEPGLLKPFYAVLGIRREADESDFEADKGRADEAIGIATTVSRLLKDCAAITHSARRPKVRAEMKRRGMPLPVFAPSAQ